MITVILEYIFIGLFGIILVWALIIDVLEDGNEFYSNHGADKEDGEASHEDEGSGGHRDS